MLGAYPLKGPGCTRVTSMRSLLFVCRLGSMKVSCGKHTIRSHPRSTYLCIPLWHGASILTFVYHP